MLFWLSTSYANDYHLSSEKEIGTHVSAFYREIQYSMPKISSKTETIDIQVSIQHFCISERNYSQVWKSNDITGLFQSKDRQYTQYEIQHCSEDSEIGKSIIEQDVSNTNTNSTNHDFYAKKIDITNIALQLHNQVHNFKLQDHPLEISIPFSEIGFLYLTDLTHQTLEKTHSYTIFYSVVWK